MLVSEFVIKLQCLAGKLSVSLMYRKDMKLTFSKTTVCWNENNVYLTSRKAEKVITDDPSTRKASHSFAAWITFAALSLGTLSPKKTTLNSS